MTKRNKETAKVKLTNGMCVPLKLKVAEDKVTVVKSGGKKVKITGDRPFLLGLGPNTKGKTKYYFAWWRKGKTMFFPMDNGQAKRLLSKGEIVGKMKEFKTPGWQQLASAKETAAAPKSPKKVASKIEAYKELKKMGLMSVVKSGKTTGLRLDKKYRSTVYLPPNSKYKYMKVMRKGDKGPAWNREKKKFEDDKGIVAWFMYPNEYEPKNVREAVQKNRKAEIEKKRAQLKNPSPRKEFKTPGGQQLATASSKVEPKMVGSYEEVLDELEKMKIMESRSKPGTSLPKMKKGYMVVKSMNPKTRSSVSYLSVYKKIDNPTKTNNGLIAVFKYKKARKTNQMNLGL
jgi:hypothetical protein